MGLHVDGTWLTPSPMQAVLSAGERPRGQSCCLAWMYIVLFLLAATSEEYLLWMPLCCAGLRPTEKSKRRTRNPVLCFESSSSIVFPLQQTSKGDETNMCLCFPVIFWNSLHWSVCASFVSGFYFITQCVQSPFPSASFLLWFFFSFVMWMQVILIILLGQFRSFVSLLDFIGSYRTDLKCGNPEFWNKQI